MDERRRLLRRVREAARRRHDAEASWLDAIGEARAAGLSLAAIAEEAGVTRGRIHQLTTASKLPVRCRHGKTFDVHCKECQIAGYCACKECERDEHA